MKVTDLHLFPNHTFQVRQLSLDDSSRAKVLVHNGSQEAVLVRPKALRFHPAPIPLLPIKEGASAWSQLLSYPDPEYIPTKKVSGFAFFNGDNPFLIVTSAGSCIPMPSVKGERVKHIEVKQQSSAVVQEAIDSKGLGAAMRQKWLIGIQVIFAGVVALATIAATAAMLPAIMDRFGKGTP